MHRFLHEEILKIIQKSKYNWNLIGEISPPRHRLGLSDIDFQGRTKEINRGVRNVRSILAGCGEGLSTALNIGGRATPWSERDTNSSVLGSHTDNFKGKNHTLQVEERKRR